MLENDKVDDVHQMDREFKKAAERFEKLNCNTKTNIDMLRRFVMSCRHEGRKKATTVSYINIAKRIVEVMHDIGIEKNIHEIDLYDFDTILLHLEDEVELKPGTIRNYKKFIKKFFSWYIEENPLDLSDHDKDKKWVRKIKLQNVESTVQPHEVLTQNELDQMLMSCHNNPRNKAHWQFLQMVE